MNIEISEYEQQALDFLKESNTKLNIIFKEFASMPWDTDGQKRNIFSCTLSNSKHEYTFDFGDSIADSCSKEPKLNLLKESDEIHLYAGVKSVERKEVFAGVNIKLTKSQLLNTDYELLTKYFEELEQTFNLKSDDKNKKSYSLFEDGKISRNERDLRLIRPITKGLAQQVIQSAIKNKIDELSKETEYSKDLQSDNIKIPTAYDVLSCLNTYDPVDFQYFCDSYGYDTDSRKAEQTFNSVKEEYENIIQLFDDEQLELLSEIQ